MSADPIEVRATVTISVDRNDRPSFIFAPFNFNVQETAPLFAPFATVQARDNDPVVSQMFYTIHHYIEVGDNDPVVSPMFYTIHHYIEVGDDDDAVSQPLILRRQFFHIKVALFERKKEKNIFYIVTSSLREDSIILFDIVCTIADFFSKVY